MNIFFTSDIPSEAAKNLCDQHVVKMILESAQLLSTAHRVLDGQQYIRNNGKRKLKAWVLDNPEMESKLYKATHVNHPCAQWVRESDNNYMWLYQHFLCLNNEYMYRFGKTHSCTFLAKFLGNVPVNISDLHTLPALAMPDKYKRKSVIESYRAYMIGEKCSFGTKVVRPARWTIRPIPDWYFEVEPHFITSGINKQGKTYQELSKVIKLKHAHLHL